MHYWQRLLIAERVVLYMAVSGAVVGCGGPESGSPAPSVSQPTTVAAVASDAEFFLQHFGHRVDVAEIVVEATYPARYQLPRRAYETPGQEHVATESRTGRGVQYVPVRLRVTHVYSSTAPVAKGYLALLPTGWVDGRYLPYQSLSDFDLKALERSSGGMVFVERLTDEAVTWSQYLFDLAEDQALGGGWYPVSLQRWFHYRDGLAESSSARGVGTVAALRLTVEALTTR